MTDRIIELLNKLWEYQQERDKISLEKQAIYETILTEEIKGKLREVDAEFQGKETAASTNINNITEEVHRLILEHGSSVKGDKLHAIYNNGRVSWDTKGLDQAIKLIPALAEYKKTGNPYVSIREAK